MHDKSELMFFFPFSISHSISVSTQTLVPDLESGVELSFKTRSPDGLLLCAFSPGNQEEFMAIQIKGGRPYFLFDPEVCKVVFYTFEECECKELIFREQYAYRILLFLSFLRDFQLPIQRHLHPAWLLLNKHAYTFFTVTYLTEGHAKIWFILKCVSVPSVL